MPKETSPAFQFYVKEWRSSRPVMRMTFAQRGMYLEMLLEQWENLDLPDSPDECADLIGGSVEEWRSNWEVLRRKFLSDERTGRIKNSRLEQVRKERRRFEKWGRENAKKGGAARAASATRRKDGTYSPAESQPGVQPEHQPTVQPGNAIAPATASASASASAREHAPVGASLAKPSSLIQRRRGDAAWEGPKGLYVTHKQHAKFVGMRNGNEREVNEWYAAVGEEWGYGKHQHTNFDPDMFRFWDDRYRERWPAAPPKPKDVGPAYQKVS